MSIPARIKDDLPFLTSLRRDLHAHPELGFEEERTGSIVATLIEEAGIAVHRGLGGTGVVGTLQIGNGTRRIGLRADMDALAMPEMAERPYKSTVSGKMHACGHDGHTAMLLGAARHLAATRNFSGTVHFIFQPAEEGRGGARRMVEDGLFQLFPCDAVYGLHNMLGLRSMRSPWSRAAACLLRQLADYLPRDRHARRQAASWPRSDHGRRHLPVIAADDCRTGGRSAATGGRQRLFPAGGRTKGAERHS